MNTKPVAVFLLSALLGGAVAALHADPTEDAVAAAKKLSTVPNYSWNVTIDQNTRTLKISGKTNIDAFSLLTFIGYSRGPGSAQNRAAGSDAAATRELKTVFLGDSRYVVEINGNWKSPDEVSTSPKQPTNNGGNAGTGGAAPGRSGSKRGGSGRAGGGGGSGQRSRSGASAQGAQDAPPLVPDGPRLPAGLNLPHEELWVIATNFTDVRVEDGGVSGNLTNSGAEILLLPPGSTQSLPKGSTGTFRLWIKDRAVTKYELKLTAKKAPDGTETKGDFSETITVELSEVGTTRVDVPPAAKHKLLGL